MRWQEFKDWISTNFVPSGDSWYWRGQRDSNWALQTTFHRRNATAAMTLHNYRWFVMSEVEYFYHVYFGEILDLHDGKDDRKMPQVELVSFLGQLQHYGFPTPLLDWTLSPYIAAFFAFHEIQDSSPQNPKVRIFAFDADTYVEDFYKEKGSFSVWDMWNTTTGIDPFVTTLKPMPKHNPRIVAQQGRFTVTNIDDMIGVIRSREQKVGKTYLYYEDLDASEKKSVMKELDLMGINEMTLFPDFEGLCREIAYKHFTPP